MDAPEIFRRLSWQTKVAILTTEAQAGQFSTSELAEILELLANGPADESSLARAALEALSSAGAPPGRVEDLRKAFGQPVGTTRQPAAALGAGTASKQQTRPVHPPFRAPFEAETIRSPAPAQEPPAPPQAAPPTTPPLPPPQAVPPPVPAPPAIPRAPLPVRGKAAAILSKGVAGTKVADSPPAANAPPEPSAPKPPEPARPADEGIRKMTFFGSAGGGAKEVERGMTPTATAARPVVLLADDDKRIRMVFRIKLEEKGFNVIEAADGQDAWRRIDAGGIHAVVLDMKMPGLHGLEILSRLADSGKNLPVVICTAYDHMEDEFVVATYPKLRYLTKPVDAGHLAETLTNLLAEQG